MPTTDTQTAQQTRTRLIVFDVEGVLIPKRRYLLFEASRRVSIVNFIRMLWAGLLYETGLTSLETALRTIYKQLSGLTVDDLLQLFKKIPLIPGAEEVTQRLKQTGLKIALISSGLPQIFIQNLANQLNCDYAFGSELETSNGRLTGQISGDVIKPGGKALVLKRIMENESLTPENCILVADDRNNLPMFNLCSTRIGYNPDFLLAYKSDIVVKGDLRETLPKLTGEASSRVHSVSKRDLVRETVHVSGFLVALFTMSLGFNHYWVAFIIIIVTLTYIISELSRMLGVNVPVVSTLTWHAALQPEVHEFVTAPIFFAFGITFALLIFPAPINYASIAIFSFGDGFATVFGKIIGKHVIPYNKGKRIEGTVAGFIFAFLGAMIFVSPLKAVAGAMAAMIIETLPAPVNDNLTMPLAAGLAMFLVP